jgi:prepilin-type N-terminal cleavage/methylation domain-containing protein
MRRHREIFGLTLVEMMVVIAVIALLLSLAITALRRIENSAKEELAAGTIASLAAACEQFSDYGYRYPNPAYADFDFPLDCNGFSAGEIEVVMADALGLGSVSIILNDPNDSGCAMLYYFLNRVPVCRVTLGEIDTSLVTDKDKNGMQIQIDIDGRVEPLLRVVDPWGTTMWYDYYDEDCNDFGEMRKSRRTFPVITSAGRDREFRTADDITSR